MESNVLTSIPGIELFPVLSLIIFVAFFAGLLAWFFRADRVQLAKLAELPLQDGSSSNGEANSTPLFDIHHQN